MRDELIRQVEEAADDVYQVVGEIGSDPSRLGFLARERETGALVALSLVSDELRVLPRLDAAVPTDGSRCANCRAELATWSDACPACGSRIVSDPFDGAASEEARRVLLDEVRSASEGEYEVIGAMDGASGSVYFAREMDGGRLVTLALQAEDEEDDACSLAATWIAPDATSEPREESVHRDPAPVRHDPAPVTPAPSLALTSGEPDTRRSWVKRLLALAGLLAVVLIAIAYVRGAPEPVAGEDPAAVEAGR